VGKRYELKRRAERQEQTRQRIVDATVALHTSVGPLHTTDAAIAERAGVTRVTFYRHFPDDVSLFSACNAHGLERWPPPDPDRWARIVDPLERLETALHELYGYYAVAGPGLLVVQRDMPLLRPELRNASPSRREVFERMAPVLASGWRVRGRRGAVGRIAIEHAIAVGTWDSLVRRGGLCVEEAVTVLVAMTRHAFGLARANAA
jgi:AcrR family transcriptional regulator